MCGQAASDNMQTSEIICKWMQGDRKRERARRRGRQSQGEGALTLSGHVFEGERGRFDGIDGPFDAESKINGLEENRPRDRHGASRRVSDDPLKFV